MTRLSGFSNSDQERQIIPDITGDEEVLPYEFLGQFTHAFAHLRAVEQIADAEGAALGGIDQEAGAIIPELQDDAPHVAADNRLAFPHGLGDRQAEPFPGGFLEDNIRGALQGVDFVVGVRRQQEHLNIRLPLGRLHDLRQSLGPFRVVGGLASGQHQLTGRMFAHHAEGLNHPHRVFKRIEPGDLQNHGLVALDVQTVQDLLDFLRGQFPVLFT